MTIGGTARVCAQKPARTSASTKQRERMGVLSEGSRRVNPARAGREHRSKDYERKSRSFSRKELEELYRPARRVASIFMAGSDLILLQLSPCLPQRGELLGGQVGVLQVHVAHGARQQVGDDGARHPLVVGRHH